MSRIDEILDFWFPAGLDADVERHAEQLRWWFGGGSNEPIRQRFASTWEQATLGQLNDWARTPRGRLALILVLDQFSRAIHAGTPLAYAADDKALSLAVDGLQLGDDAALPHVWEKAFLVLPLGHSESLTLQNTSVAFNSMLAEIAPAHLKPLYEHSVTQARGHREVIQRFGRHPHRNAVLGRTSTPAEIEHLATTTPVHLQGVPKLDALLRRLRG